jgi:ABC-type sugar transport system permease subunit
MKRLRIPFVLLVIAPAVILALGGSYIAYRSWAALRPELDRHAAVRAVEYMRLYRDALGERLRAPTERLAAQAAELGLERFTVYDARDRVVVTFPEATPLPLALGGAAGEALLAAARRGNAVVDLVLIDDRPTWLAYLPDEGSLTVATVRAGTGPTDAFAEAVDYDMALYLGTARALVSGEGWPNELSRTLIDSLASFDRALSIEVGGERLAAVPFKDFDEWDVTGAVVVREGTGGPPLPSPPFVGMALLTLAAGLAVLLIARVTLAEGGPGAPRRLRRGFALALVIPAVAAATLATGDARVSARATDSLLALSGRVVAQTADTETTPVDRFARLAGADVVRLAEDTLAAATVAVPAAALAALESEFGRVRIGDRRYAYRIVASEAGQDVFLLAHPLEDSRKTVLFWLAGLYGLLAVGALIYASLALSAGSRMGLRETTAAWSFIAPSLVLLLVFSAAPLLFAFYLSFHGWNLLEPAKPFVGLGHYIELAGDGLFWNAAKNTAIYALYVPLTMACALGVAILLNRRIKGVALLRAIFFLPYITSFVAISIVWQWMYDPNFGIFNWVLGLFGLGPFPWLNSPSTALMALIILAVWIHIGFQMIIFLAGLQAIPNELYEAAMIDGAGPWRRFWRITLPMLKPTTFFVLVTSIIGSFQVFTFVYVMTEGGPLHATDVIVYHIYQNAWQFLRMGYASAMSWVLFAVIFVITLIQFRLLGRRMTPS